MYRPYQDFLSQLQNTLKHRKLPELGPIKPCLNFASNDYLMLSKHPNIIAATAEAMKQYGCGASGSRLLSGNYPLIQEFEAQIAKDKHSEQALLFASGFQANFSTLSALIDPKILGQEAVVFFDKYNHSSLYQALGTKHTKLLRYRHLDMNHLESLLQKHRHHSFKFLVTETVFGMDGDIAPIPQLIDLCQRYDCFLYLDEAHATGLYGPKHYGVSTQYDLSKIPHLIMGTFSKAIGSHGAYIACDAVIHDYLINACQGFIYTTANSPLTIAAAFAAWKLLPSLGQEVQQILGLAAYLQQKWAIPCNQTNITPLILKTEDRTLALQKHLFDHGIIASAIRPPTVPPGSARLRVAIHSGHKQEDIDYLIEVLASC